jgi:peptide/nickel transport system substrate-binding protein
MKAIYPLRPGVTWHDGQPFTAQDLMFSFELAMDQGVPKPALSAISQMDSAEAPDDQTFVIYWKAPYYQADSVGLRAFWPVPRHIMEQPYRTLDRQAFTNLPYWTTEFVHLGPFKLEELRPGDSVIFSAYDHYFLGRPKVDRIIVRIFGSENGLYAATLAGAVDILVDSSLGADRGLELAETWERDGKGTVHIGNGSTRFIAPQFDPALQKQPALLDPRIRAALLYATDRQLLSQLMQHGHGERVATALLPPGDRLYDAVKDGLAHFVYDPAQARRIIGEAGWSQGPDGIMVNAAGARLVVPLWVTEGSENEIAALADFWKQAGVEGEQNIVPSPLVRDRQYRQAYSGVEISGAGAGDSILIRVDGRESTNPPNYFGNNRGHYASPRLDGLMDRYRASVAPADQARAMKDLSDFWAEDLPVMPLYYGATTPAVRTGIKALDDYRGSADGAQIYGTVTRNAHEWDVL